MQQCKRTQSIRNVLGIATSLLLAVIGNNTGQAYELYTDGCNDCHGNFRDATTTKGTVFSGGNGGNNHDMHRARNTTTNMNIGCNLCHIGTSRTPVYTWQSNGTNGIAGLGCTGCHVAAGLRKHHAVNGVTCYGGCHSSNEVADPENVSPPYYGTADTRVRNPGNTVLAAYTNENWSVGDFLGLDNDGDNLYDLADYDISPRDRILGSTQEGNNRRVTWQTYGGRTNTLQAAGKVSGTYSNVSSAVTATNVGPVTTNYLDVGGATNTMRFYRLQSQVP